MIPPHPLGSTRHRLLQEFFSRPTAHFQMRELSRNTKIAQPSVMNHLRALQEQNLIVREKHGVYPAYQANRDSQDFKLLKQQDLVRRLHAAGLIDYLYDTCLPDVIILFGSASRGEDTEKSDIDLFLKAESSRIDLNKYERLFCRKISVFFEENFGRLTKELKNNILNGTILRGYITVF